MKSSGLENQSPQRHDFAATKISNELSRDKSHWKLEAAGIIALAAMVVYFLALSWRRWSDPLIDGYVWYNAWQLSHGAILYHDVPLVYGPLAAYFDAFLFRIFGTGMMVLVTSHLVVYSAILALIYFTFRIAWGRLGAFAASSVFISIFSFSQLQECGNFNFAAPYSHEIVYGIFLTLIAVLIAARLCRRKSILLASLLGLCAGLATVLKPEFMLACGFLGGGVLLVRWFYKKPFSIVEFVFTAIGLVIPTLLFTIAFAQSRPWKIAFANASQAWWQVVFAHIHVASALQQNAAGLNDPWVNGFAELAAAASAILVIGAIWFIGWSFNRPWPNAKRAAAILVAAGVIFAIGSGGDWLEVGLCLPGLVAVLFFLIIAQLRRERRDENPINPHSDVALGVSRKVEGLASRRPENNESKNLTGLKFLNGFQFVRFHRRAGRHGFTSGETPDATFAHISTSEFGTHRSTVMALMLVLVAASMLARMILQARIYDFGFFQAAFAGMTVAAALVFYIPKWAGPKTRGGRLAMFGCVALLVLACVSIAADSRRVRLAQTQPVGSGRDRIYAFDPRFDSTGALVHWVVENLKSIPPQATVMGVPEGAMINYLSRHKHPLPFWVPIDGGSTTEKVEEIINRLRASPPDYVVLISRSMKEHGLKQFGAPGTPGEKTLKWITDNYFTIASRGGSPLVSTGEKGAVILKRKPTANH